MDKKKLKRWIRRHDRLVNIVLLAFGLVFFFCGYFLKSNYEMWGDLIIEIGLAFITNAFLLASSLLYFKNDEDVDNAKELFEKNGLISIYESKKKMNEKINDELLPNYKVLEYDIICCGGLTTLLREKGPELIEYIKKNRMRIRILTANPNLEYLLQKKIDEDSVPSTIINYTTTPISNDIRTSIFHLYNWIIEQKALLPDELKDNLQIRFYNTLPPMQYHRVGNSLLIGQSIIGSSSQASPAFEFVNSNNPNDFFSKFTQSFETLWNDPNLTQPTPKVKLNPQTIINDNIINNILRLSCSDIASDLGVDLPNRIGAVFTICGYPKPFDDGKQRRFNTNVVRSGEVINIENSKTNGTAINGQKPGYYAQDENQVVGKCIRDGCIKFEVTQENGRYSILAIPFKNKDDEVVAAITYEFDTDFNVSLHINENDEKGKDLSILNRKVIEKAEKWAQLLSIYLHLQEL